MMLKFIFWILLFAIFYTYLGYGLLLFICAKLKSIIKKREIKEKDVYEPEVSLLIPAYNEASFVKQKVENSFQLNYPKNKIRHIWVTDGSSDETNQILNQFEHITVYHESERKGKIGAINRAMQFIETPIVIFSDANTLLAKDTITEIVKCFANPNVGCVAGEKKINTSHKDIIHTGEGFYWKLESLMKKWESELHSAIAAAGEIFAIRTQLFESVKPNIILDDLVISLQIAQQGHLIKYSSKAIAIENASINVKEELKRKIRIASGGFQALSEIGSILNPFKYGILSFFFLSHKAIRWTLAPLFLLAIVPISCILFLRINPATVNTYSIFFVFQSLFYIFSLIGMFLKNKRSSFKIFSIPFYFCIMNYSIYAGFFRFIRKKQSVNWEKTKRC